MPHGTGPVEFLCVSLGVRHEGLSAGVHCGDVQTIGMAACGGVPPAQGCRAVNRGLGLGLSGAMSRVNV